MITFSKSSKILARAVALIEETCIQQNKSCITARLVRLKVFRSNDLGGRLERFRVWAVSRMLFRGAEC